MYNYFCGGGPALHGELPVAGGCIEIQADCSVYIEDEDAAFEDLVSAADRDAVRCCVAALLKDLAVSLYRIRLVSAILIYKPKA